jgi:predicted NUDIX family NTP pyrophosphohydrolase
VATTSAGVLLYRPGADGPEVLLGHMGGPFWARKDAGAWSIPKGEHGPEEDPRAAAAREFEEELGVPLPPGPLEELGSVRTSGGKVITAFALAADLDPARIVPGVFVMEWPPRSGRTQEFPEIDRAAWFALDEARERINPAQAAFLDRLARTG